jgi:hypothetical protein
MAALRAVRGIGESEAMPRHLEVREAMDDPGRHVQRVQTGVRMEKRLVKVLKALAELYDRSLGDLLEGIVLHAFEGRSPFSADGLRRIAELERIYGLDLAARAGRRPLEPPADEQRVPRQATGGAAARPSEAV